MRELKKCPFCGGEAEHKMYLCGIDVNGKAVWRYYVFCTSCDCTSDNMYESKAEAVTAWNTRAETEAEKKIEEVREKLNLLKKDARLLDNECECVEIDYVADCLIEILEEEK